MWGVFIPVVPCVARVTKLLLLFLFLFLAGPPTHDGTYQETDATEWLTSGVLS